VIVADTCVVIWLAGAPSNLSRAANEAIFAARQSGGLAISGITLYELAWLAEHKRLPLATPVEPFLAEVAANFIVLPVTASVGLLAARFPAEYPADPMDRIIGATALDRGVPLITRDRAIRESNALNVIW
jgi:PIN domain nuclease of toxin-antitoxin system